jgi:hypothetical protein
VPETLTERLLAIAALFGAAVLFALAVVDRDQRSARVVAPVASEAEAGAVGSEPTLAVSPVAPAVSTAQAPASRPSAAPSTAKLVVTAARGSCWVSIHAGSADGEVLFEGILENGRTVRFARDRIWIRLGAAANVDVSVNGKRAGDLPGGTVDLVATKAGIAPQTA